MLSKKFGQKTLKNILVSAIPLILALSANVTQSAERLDSASSMASRRAILQPGGTSVLIGLATNRAREEDIQYMITSLLPTANYLSRETRSIVSFIPDRNKQVYMNDVANKSFKFIYCEFDDCISPIANGYLPILKRADLQRAVIIAKSDSGIKSEAQLLSGMKLGIYGDSTVTTLAQGSLPSLSVMKIIDLNQHTMASSIEAARTGEVSAVLTSSNNLSKMIGNFPGQFNIVAKSKSVPNAMLLARRGTDTSEINRFVSAFTDAQDVSEVLLDTEQHYGPGIFQAMSPDDVVVLNAIVLSSKKTKKLINSAAVNVNMPAVNKE